MRSTANTTNGLCECGCGQITNVFNGQHNRFISGHNDNRSLKHGHCGSRTNSRTYVSWQAMLSRCVHYRHEEVYPHYVGIGVCDRWNPEAGGGFENFLEDRR